LPFCEKYFETFFSKKEKEKKRKAKQRRRENLRTVLVHDISKTQRTKDVDW
jgi:hypothetical protein